jgi:periodic tryptophan protein 1
MNNLFVHHEIMLSAFPLDIEWLKVNLGSINSSNPTKGNYAIVSSFLPEIEIWNLDLTEAIQPDVILGGEIQQSSKKPKKFTNSSKKYKTGSHTDAVTSLSLNCSNLSVLASGSIDTTVKIWDISKETCVHTSAHHKSGIKKVEWSSVDVSVIFTASADNSITILDSRFPNDQIVHNALEGEEIERYCSSYLVLAGTSTTNLKLPM